MSNNVFSYKCISSLPVGCSNYQLYRSIVHIIGRVLGNILHDIDLKVKGHIMYFLVNVSSHKQLDEAISNFAGA